MLADRREMIMAAAAAVVGAPGLAAAAAGPALCNPHASAEARALYNFLCAIYRKHTLTGQQELPWPRDKARRELDYIQSVSGKLPAILGLDYIIPEDWPGVADRATRWYRNEGGVPTICWHWGAPDIGTGYENSQRISTSLRRSGLERPRTERWPATFLRSPTSLQFCETGEFQCSGAHSMSFQGLGFGGGSTAPPGSRRFGT